MIATLRRSTVALVAFAAAIGASAPAFADCKPMGAIGTGVNETIAKFMADAALKNVRDNAGYKPSGTISYKCVPAALPLTIDCHASQKVCK